MNVYVLPYFISQYVFPSFFYFVECVMFIPLFYFVECVVSIRFIFIR